MKRIGLVVAAPLVVFLIGATRKASAQVEDRASAERLFDEGRRLLDTGMTAEACAKFEASERLDAAVGTLLNLADCYERRGKIASAWSTYRAATSLGLSRGDLGRAAFAKKRAEALQPRLSTLTIRVTAPERGLIVRRDGATVEPGAWGTPLPVDAGSHVVEVSAPAKTTWSQTVDIVGERSETVVPVGALAPAPPVADSAPSSTPSSTAAVGTQSQSASTGSTLRVFGGVGAALGVVGLGLGGYFSLRAKSTWSDAHPHCDANNVCDDAGYELNQSARSMGNAATASFAAGGTLLLGGLAAIFFSPRGPAPPAQPALMLGPRGFVGLRVSLPVP